MLVDLPCTSKLNVESRVIKPLAVGLLDWKLLSPACVTVFTQAFRKYIDQHSQCNICAVHDGKVGCNTVKYTMVFLYSDWLYFLWHGIKVNIYEQSYI